MATTKKPDVNQLLAAFKDVEVRALLPDGTSKELAAATAAAAFNSYIGTIAFAGRTSSSTYQVQFNTGSSGYSSSWPQWAYEVALPALLHGKQVWVISNGLPFGSNLTQVLILK
jgi:hypothetical protein